MEKESKMAKYVLTNRRYIRGQVIPADVENPQIVELPESTKEDTHLKRYTPGAERGERLGRPYVEKSGGGVPMAADRMSKPIEDAGDVDDDQVEKPAKESGGKPKAAKG